MKKSMWIVLVALLLGSLALAACGGGGGGGAQRQDPPADFANLTNPFEGDAAAVSAGQELYVSNCAGCHGESAQGDGPAGQALDPRPANLVNTAKETEDQYIYWVIHEGGAAAGLSPSMISYAGVLTEDQIWQITTYIESLE